MHQLEEFEDQKTKDLKLFHHYLPEHIPSKRTGPLSVETQINFKVIKNGRKLLQSNVCSINKMATFNCIFPHLRRTILHPSKTHEETHT